MKLPGAARLRRGARWLRSRLVRRSLVLLYHRVADLETDPQLLAVSPRRFAEHMDVLRRLARPVRLSHLASQVADGAVSQGEVAVTFDDGYADNLLEAGPILERADVPATVFVTAGAVGQDRELWWDELERILLLPGLLPDRLSEVIGGERVQFELTAAQRWTEADQSRHRSWTVEQRSDPSARHTLYRTLHRAIRGLGVHDRAATLERLRAWAGLGPAGRPTHRALSPDEVTRLARGGLLEVGAHTMTHPCLSSLRLPDQLAEIERSKARLEELTGTAIRSFAYPYGTRADYTPQTVTLVRAAGFDFAASNVPDVVWRGSRPYELPRLVMRDLDGEAFSRALVSWLGD